MQDDWVETSVGALLSCPPRNGYSPSEVDAWTGTLMLGLGCLTEDGFLPAQLKNAPRNDTRLEGALLNDGDLLMSRANTRKRVGFAGRYRSVGWPCIYPDLMMRLRPVPNVVASHLERLLRSNSGRRQIEAAAVGTSGSMVKINRQVVEGLRFVLPTLPEQLRIAETLDAIDDAIYKTGQVIHKLQKVHKGLLRDLLTRGVDENGELRDPVAHPEHFKDSPLGLIPKGWATPPLGQIAFLQNGHSFKEHELTDAGIRIVRISNLKKPSFPYWHYDGKIKEKLLIRPGDLLFTWAGVDVSIDVFIYRGPTALLNQHIYNLRISSDALRRWAFVSIKSQLPSIRRQIEGGAGQLHLTRAQVAGIHIHMPPDAERADLLKLVATSQQRISQEHVLAAKLRATRKGVMDDLLTGNVRFTMPGGEVPP